MAWRGVGNVARSGVAHGGKRLCLVRLGLWCDTTRRRLAVGLRRRLNIVARRHGHNVGGAMAVRLRSPGGEVGGAVVRYNHGGGAWDVGGSASRSRWQAALVRDMAVGAGKWRREQWRLGLYRRDCLRFQAWMVMCLSVHTLGCVASIGRWGMDARVQSTITVAVWGTWVCAARSAC